MPDGVAGRHSRQVALLPPRCRDPGARLLPCPRKSKVAARRVMRNRQPRLSLSPKELARLGTQLKLRVSVLPRQGYSKRASGIQSDRQWDGAEGDMDNSKHQESWMRKLNSRRTLSKLWNILKICYGIYTESTAYCPRRRRHGMRAKSGHMILSTQS